MAEAEHAALAEQGVVDQPAGGVERHRAGLRTALVDAGHQLSRVPSSTLGRRMRISTSSRYGRIGAAWASVMRSSDHPGVCGPIRPPKRLIASAIDASTVSGSVWISPISSEATNAPASRSEE